MLSLLAVGMLGAACAGGARPAAGPPPDQGGPSISYVAVGASESVGFGTDDPLRQAWPRVLFRTALPRRTTFVNLGIPGATVDDALRKELPDAVNLAPTVVTVWLNVNDIIALVPPSDYERQLSSLVHQLRRGGATKVLVANTPPLDHLPAYLSCRLRPAPGSGPCMLEGVTRLFVPPPGVVNDIVDQYNSAISRVADKEGAVLVDLHALGMRARADGSEAGFVSKDGFHPSVAGHEAVARGFADAVTRSGGVG